MVLVGPPSYSRVSKVSRDPAVTVESSRLFHSVIVFMKNECLYCVVPLLFGILNVLVLFIWWCSTGLFLVQFSNVFTLIFLLLLFGCRYACCGMAGTRSSEIL